MPITLNLDPEIERSLAARAGARGMSLGDFLQELLAGEANASVEMDLSPVEERFANFPTCS